MKPPGIQRRRLAAAGLLALVPAQRAMAAAGELQPRLPPPPLVLRDADDRPYPLHQQLRGHATAVHLMFTGCSTICPPQAALFATLAQAPLPANVSLLSISIDTLGDTPAVLAGWLQRFGHPPRWQAAVPTPRDLDALVAWLRGPDARSDTHTAQVFLVDRRGCLCYRSGDMPTARSMLAALEALSRET
jgi:protein SCO1